jgi:hypothetical protein
LEPKTGKKSRKIKVWLAIPKNPSKFDGRPESGVGIAPRSKGKISKFKNGCEIEFSRGAELLFGKNESMI